MWQIIPQCNAYECIHIYYTLYLFILNSIIIVFHFHFQCCFNSSPAWCILILSFVAVPRWTPQRYCASHIRWAMTSSTLTTISWSALLTTWLCFLATKASRSRSLGRIPATSPLGSIHHPLSLKSKVWCFSLVCVFVVFNFVAVNLDWLSVAFLLSSSSWLSSSVNVMIIIIICQYHYRHHQSVSLSSSYVRVIIICHCHHVSSSSSSVRVIIIIICQCHHHCHNHLP